jgi:uncharacterized protein YjiS (DUF1127 family)
MSQSIPRLIPLDATQFGACESRPAHSTAWLTRMSSLIGLWSARRRQRKALSDLAEFNAHLLQDIGITADEAGREAAKWFWQGEYPRL